METTTEYRLQYRRKGEWVETGSVYATPEEAFGMIEFYAANESPLEFRVVWREIGEWRPFEGRV